MADNSKLEIFKLISKRYTFREVAISKCGLDEAQENDNQIFNSLYGLFLQKLTQNEVWTNNRTKLGLVLFSSAGENVNEIFKAHSDACVIEGFIDGGPYDRIRRMAEKDDTTTTTLLDRNKIVTDRYYLYLYLPLNSYVGLMFLERKKGQDIHTPMALFLNEILKVRNNIHVERYVPQSIIEDFKDEGIIDSFTFTDTIVSPVLDGNAVEQQESNYDVSVSIKPRAGEALGYNMLQEALNSVGNVVVNFGNSVKSLSQFRTKKARIQRNNEGYNFSIGDDLKIRPMIEIADDIHDRDNDTLMRDQAYAMVNALLRQIKDDIYPIQEE